jgi:hypothetical protein
MFSNFLILLKDTGVFASTIPFGLKDLERHSATIKEFL